MFEISDKENRSHSFSAKPIAIGPIEVNKSKGTAKVDIV